MLPDEPTIDPEQAREAQFQELLAQCRSGDQAAIGRLVEQFRLILLSEVNGRMNDNLRAKIGCSDIVQETMLAAQRNFDQFSGRQRSEFLAWMYQIVRNDMLQTVRRFKSAKRNVELESPLETAHSSESLQGSDGSPVDNVLVEEQAAMLRAALMRLNPDYQQVIQLRNWQQLSFAEIGSMMNRSPDAARKLWSRALIELQSAMEELSSLVTRRPPKSS